MPKLSILLSTIDDRIFQAENILKSSFPDCEYIIIHQISDVTSKEQYSSFYHKFPAPLYKFIQQFERGTGKSRNLALKNATGELFFICDDDIVFADDFFETIMKASEKYPEADIFTFMIKSDTGSPYKKYFKNVRWHTLNSTAKVSNVEMVIRKNFYERSKIRFDELFGLGTVFNTGEEFALLADALKAKGKILFVPIYIVTHPKQSSGNTFTPELIKAKGAMIVRVYKWKYWGINFLFAIKKYKEYKNSYTFFTFLKYIYAGSFQYHKYK